MESTDTISAPSFSARSNATSDFPTAVGPARRIQPEAGFTGPAAELICLQAVAVSNPASVFLRLFRKSGLRRRRQTREHHHQDQPNDKNPDADQVRRRGPAAEIML